jgi:hypothetical protein
MSSGVSWSIHYRVVGDEAGLRDMLVEDLVGFENAGSSSVFERSVLAMSGWGGESQLTLLGVRVDGVVGGPGQVRNKFGANLLASTRGSPRPYAAALGSRRLCLPDRPQLILLVPPLRFLIKVASA